jgi:hypothetical protein
MQWSEMRSEIGKNPLRVGETDLMNVTATNTNASVSQRH